ncbi:MAG: PUA domain-containing protein, partial [Candidatus Altiarchaeota archaeon]
KGDTVSVADRSGREFARGMTNFSSEEVEKIMGKQSVEIQKITGKKIKEVIHHDNMVLVGK